MTDMPVAAYLLCATPRTGSTLLCTLLESTGVAGRPHSYFRKPDFYKWAAGWGIPRTAHGHFLFADYLRGALAAGRSDNGVFAVRIMWGTMGEVVSNLRALYADHVSSDSDLLARAFGPTRIIYLRRKDSVAQAVSRARAEQTEVWHITDDEPSAQPARSPRYDFEQIRSYVREIDAHNEAWAEWFGTQGIQPYHVWYEDMATAPVQTTHAILDFLQIDLPSNIHINVSNKRLADCINTSWIARYHADLRTHDAP